MTMAHLKGQARDKLRRPSFLVLCSPSGLPVESLMQQLTAQQSSSVGRIVTHSSRTPLVSCPLALALRNGSIKLCCSSMQLTGDRWLSLLCNGLRCRSDQSADTSSLFLFTLAASTLM